MFDTSNVGIGASVVSPSDTAEFQFKALYIGVTGNLKIGFENGTSCTFANVPVGFFPMAGTMVYNTGTTASSIVGIA